MPLQIVGGSHYEAFGSLNNYPARILSPLLFMIGLASCSGGGGGSSQSSTGVPPGPGSGGSAGPTITALALPFPTGFAAIHNGELVWGDRDKNINLHKASL